MMISRMWKARKTSYSEGFRKDSVRAERRLNGRSEVSDFSPKRRNFDRLSFIGLSLSKAACLLLNTGDYLLPAPRSAIPFENIIYTIACLYTRSQGFPPIVEYRSLLVTFKFYCAVSFGKPHFILFVSFGEEQV